jgi:hypothetical protein
MESLPMLVLETICEYLVQYDAKRQSLHAFALTSKECCAAATRERFSLLVIRASTAEQLRNDTEALGRFLGYRKKYVRIVKITGATRSNEERLDEANEDEASGDDLIDFLSETADDTYGRAAIDDEDDPYIIQPHPRVEFEPTGWKEGFSPEKRARTDHAWTSVACFISTLTLKDLVWASTEQVPLCILSTLHKHFPSCRLHVHTFSLRSLYYSADISSGVEESEYLLATSPCLYSIVGPYSFSDRSKTYYNSQALLQMISNYSPNLRRVQVYHSLAPSGEIHSIRHRSSPWGGFSPQYHVELHTSASSTTKGQLHMLAIVSKLYLSELETWESCTDFSFLVTLDFLHGVELEALSKLAEMAGMGTFINLQELRIEGGFPDDDPAEVDPIFERFIAALPPLKTLVVVGVEDATLTTILQHHAPGLRHLQIKRRILSLPNVHELVNTCSKVRELTIEILRTGGDAEEVKKYQAIGHMPDLISLTLKLRCSEYAPTGPDALCISMNFPGKDFIHQALINAALNEVLAKSIFATIRKSDTQAISPLSRVELHMDGLHTINNNMTDCAFQNAARWIARSWVFQRDPRDTHCHEFTLRELGLRDRLRAGREFYKTLDSRSGHRRWSNIWKKIWPGSGDTWKDNWHSFPLAIGNEGASSFDVLKSSSESER